MPFTIFFVSPPLVSPSRMQASLLGREGERGALLGAVKQDRGSLSLLCTSLLHLTTTHNGYNELHERQNEQAAPTLI